MEDILELVLLVWAFAGVVKLAAYMMGTNSGGSATSSTSSAEELERCLDATAVRDTASFTKDIADIASEADPVHREHSVRITHSPPPES